MTRISCNFVVASILIWNIFILAGAAYLIYWKGVTAWLLLLAILLMSPSYNMITGKSLITIT
ncbi:hypothetical protein QKC54_gp0445 [Megavirus baoshan]|uniref:Uncharacterized protein n=1 Tax=Megavirus baoshan TaxID=2496520 RepID=A0A8K1T175_9VIRU|nr:hypothetical protein QKC54_gp0445 [Megavirus baoshan]UFX99830.1 hypothetical protein Mb0627 [Megavirus baoshan]